MLALLFLSAIGTTFAIDAFLGDDNEPETTDDVIDEPETSEDLVDEPEDETSDDTADLGASFAVTDTGVSIELGEDETGSVAVIYYSDSEDTGYSVDLERDEARYYLVPEGVDWTDQNWENRYDIPGSNTEYPTQYELADFEESFGLELLGVVDLLGVDDDVEDPSDRVGEVVSNTPISEYYLAANTDGDDLVSFLPTDYVVTINGVPETFVDQDTVGSDGVDWFITDADGITIDGGGGDDRLESENNDVTIIGGDGDDEIRTYGPGATRTESGGSRFSFPTDDTELETGIVVDAGAGDDRILSYVVDTVDGGAGDDDIKIAVGTALGGTGDDSITVYGGPGTGPGAVAHGEDGDDYIRATGNAVVYGDGGEDRLNIGVGAEGHGGEGNDTFQPDSGSTSFGGAGDDTFNVYEHIGNEDGSIVMTGGEGADTFTIEPRNSTIENDEPFVRITDFDVEEDVLVVNTGIGISVINNIEIIDADDGSYSDVVVTYQTGYAPSYGEAEVVIRLDGNTGITLDHVLIDV